MQRRRGNQEKLSYRLKQYWPAYLLLLPVVLWYAIFCYAPMGGLVIAFKKYSVIKGIWNSPWVGLKNFERLFGSAAFMRSIQNTLVFSGLNFVFGFPLPIIFAILLNEMPGIRYKKIVQTVSYLPHFISWVTLSGLFIQLLSPSTGPLAALARIFGMTPYYFMGEVTTFRWVLVVTNIWKSVGWGSIIYLAALSGVDQAMYEAALIDGASRFQRVWYITLPSIVPTVTVMLILQSGSILNDNFDQVYNMMNSAVYRVSNVLGVYTYDLGLKNMTNTSLAEATAVGLFKNVIALTLVLLTNAISKKISDNGIW